LKIAPRAEQDLEDIENYLAREAGVETAVRVVDDILERLAKLEEIASSAGTPRPDLGTGVRSWPLGRYVAYYRESRGEIEIARIRHGARDPQTLTLI